MAEQVKGILDFLFRAPEQEVRTFSELMRTPTSRQVDALPGADGLHDPSEVQGAVTSMPNKVRSAVYQRQASVGVVIEHGWHGADYVWHIEPDRRRSWTVTTDRVIVAIARTINTVVPHHVGVDIFMPYADWDRKIITFKAYELGECWNVADSDLKRLVTHLFTVLSSLIK